MVARDVGVQLSPLSLDTVGIRTIRRKKMKLDSSAETGNVAGCQFAAVDNVVVEYHVDGLHLGMTRGELPKQLTE